MMAYEQDKDGCWIEPLPNIRAAAADLLTRCQLFPEDPVEEPEPDDKPIPETKEEEPESESESESEQQENDTAGSRSYGAGSVNYSLGDMNSAPAIISASTVRPSPAQRSSLITAVASPYQHGEIILDLEDSYLLPVNSTVLIQESTGERLTYHVIASEVGRLLVRPTTQPANPIVERKVVHIGVLAQ